MRFPVSILTWGLICLTLTFINCSDGDEITESRVVQPFTENWLFHLGDLKNGEDPALADSGWRMLDLPHDWSIEGSFGKEHQAGVGGGALPGGIGWYRKTFTIPAEESDKLTFIEFDGIYRSSEVWINGHYLGKRPNGYISFRYELTSHLNYGDEENVLAVRADNSRQPNSRWYSGSGIYRNVRLVQTNPVYVDQWGTHITTPEVSEERTAIEIESSIVNRYPDSLQYGLSTVILDGDGRQVAADRVGSGEPLGSSGSIKQEFTIEGPDLWSINNPALYRAVTTILVNGREFDRYETTFGIREFRFDREKGFFLNGEHVKILGVCEHHDLGALGAAVNRRAIERRLEILKDMGVNAIRTAHNPPSPELLELTDTMGFIVMDEAFDAWKMNKTEYGYHENWDEWHTRDLRDLIKRDRNHPSVMIWSIGNEILEQWDSTGTAIAQELAGIVRELDKSRPITSGMNNPQPGNAIIGSGALDLIGYNYHHETFSDFLEMFPGEKFIATETTSALATRGEYDMPSDSIRRWPEVWDKPFTDGNEDFTVSSYDNVSTPWGSTHEETWRAVKGKDYISGMFIWTGFDYLGEPTPYGWPSRSSYFGILDLAGFTKDSYYMYQSEWTDKDVLHLFPHWNWQKGDTVDVWVYSSENEVELFLNEKYLGRKSKPEGVFHTQWRVPYEPGTIKAASYEGKKLVMMKEIHTAGKAHRIELSADRASIQADGRDLSFVKVKIMDRQGNLVPDADNLVEFNIEGNGFITGVDNGNPVSHEPFKADYRKAFNGLCQAIVRSTSEIGSIRLTAISKGLESDSITITTK